MRRTSSRITSRQSSRQSKNFRVKRRIFSAVKIVGGMAVIAAFFYTLSAVSSMDVFAINNVRISGIDDSGVVESMHASVLESLQGKSLHLFSNSNTILFPRRDISQMVKDKYPEVESVTLDRDGTHTLNVNIKEKDPSALVCTTLPDFNGNELSLSDSSSCYFADDTGFIFKKAPSFSGRVYHRYYVPDLSGANLDSTSVDATSTEGVIGLYATSTIEFSKVQKFYEGLQQNNIIADAVLSKGGGEYELYVRNPFMSSSTAVVYFNTTSSSTEQLSNLISFWSHTVNTARTKKSKIGFDYIDVRYGDNVFYRQAQ